MKLILQEKIANLGKVGDVVKVKPGFARNFLIPNAKAVVANDDNLAAFELRRAELEKAAEEVLKAAEARAESLKAVNVTLEAQAGDEGKLFGSIGPRDIAEAVTAAGHALNKSEVLMPEGPIRHIGEYPISVQVHSEVVTEIQVEIVPSKA